MSNVVYIATSLDGFIADRDGGLDWLHSVPNPQGDDLGFAAFLAGIDALLMGRNTYQSILDFNLDLPSQWPYPKPVYVVGSSPITIPDALEGKVFALAPAEPAEMMATLAQMGHRHLYLDGGNTIQRFMAQGLVDELIISQIPVVLGGGVPLFGALPTMQSYELVSSEVMLGAMVKSHYRRIR
ncbi:bifunctional deaminase-reductase domain protein [Ferrimonas balearica DSM 9799]|uniref:Bifunctional deaminase-reductase domain protein n=1 Tax=Ferrimonas balearica (strain DSM 9799 / CCM 4581 / KCTC 23876 / PAT) TaxID=550540 RepID=E1SNZ0_FERBD|nr:dihydrofolate reductase family protein [Ferrimonas balearica]ADN74639.1 bifunctional deaminase-reductase domain protein [Ferrimonas balearica DSM 9799]